MKDRQIDDLFRKELEAFQAEPSADAWKRVDGNIHPKRESWKFYMGIAASLLVLFLITFVLVNPGKETQPLLSDNQVAVSDTEDKQDNNNPVIGEVQTVPSGTAEEQPEGKRTQEQEIPGEIEEQHRVVENLVASNEPQDQGPGIVEGDTEQLTIPEVYMIDLEKVEGIAKVDDIMDNPAISLNAQTYQIEMPAAETNETGSDRAINFRKVVDIAKDLKNNTNGWGALREAKNEFLSLGRKRNEESEED